MKKRVKAKVINADWEIKKYEMRQRIKSFKEDYGEFAKDCLIGFGIGACVGAGYLGGIMALVKIRNI